MEPKVSQGRTSLLSSQERLRNTTVLMRPPGWSYVLGSRHHDKTAFHILGPSGP